MSFFDKFGKKKTGIPEEKQNEPEKESSALPKANPENTDAEAYFFENPIEFMLYNSLYAKGKNLYWLSGDNYWVEFKKGYQLFEQGQYSSAVEAYKKCLELNPIGLSARFEICEAYIKMGDFFSARRILFEMKDFLIEEKSIARFYRRMGYIETEKGNYKVAAACYLYSHKFEDHPLVVQELMYIMSKDESAVASENPERVLSSAGLLVLAIDRSRQKNGQA